MDHLMLALEASCALLKFLKNNQQNLVIYEKFKKEFEELEHLIKSFGK